MAKCSFFSNIFSNVQNSRSTPLRPRARRARSEQQLQPATSNSVCSAVVLLLLLAYTYMLAGALDSRASHGGVLSSVLRGMSR